MMLSLAKKTIFAGMFLFSFFGLWGCGGGGSSTSSTPTPVIAFSPASTGGATSDLLTLSLNIAASTASLAVIDLNGTNLNTSSAYGISADLKFDSTWMTFSSFTPDATNATTAIVLPLETDPNTLVIGLYKVKNPSGHLGTFRFNLNPTGKTAPLVFVSSSTYIGTLGSVLASPALKGFGGTLNN